MKKRIARKEGSSLLEKVIGGAIAVAVATPIIIFGVNKFVMEDYGERKFREEYKQLSKLVDPYLDSIILEYGISAVPKSRYLDNLTQEQKAVPEEKPEGVKTRVDYSQNNVEKVRRKYQEIDSNLVKSVIMVESGGNPRAVSRKGAKGLMQIMPLAWNEVEKEVDYLQGVFNSKKNVEVGTKYLLKLEDYCEKNHPYWGRISSTEKQELVAAAYNGGIGKLISNGWDISKMPKETRSYVKKVMEYQRLQKSAFN